MAAGQWNTQIEQGATWSYELVWTDSESNPVDLTGYAARMSIRKLVGRELSVHLSTENGHIVIDGASGKITLALSAEDTAQIPAVPHVYDLELVAPDGQVVRLLKGKIEVDEEQTEDGDA